MKRLFLLTSIVIGLALCQVARAATSEELAQNPDFVDIGKLRNVTVDLRYATTNNFVGENLYGEFKTAYLHKLAADKFKQAIAAMQREKPGWKFIVFDSTRPRSVQLLLWEKVKGTPQQQYVADPEIGSVHNYGFALDLSLLDRKGKEIDMGTPFDSFQDLAQPALERKFLQSGKLTPEQEENRNMLRRFMAHGGFVQIPNEWWHFDALPISKIKKTYKIVE